MPPTPPQCITVSCRVPMEVKISVSFSSILYYTLHLDHMSETPADNTYNDLSDLTAILESIQMGPVRRLPDSNATNKRIHVNLNNIMMGDITRVFSRNQEVVKSTLNKLWRKFGDTTDVFYEREFKYCFVSFSSHDHAAAALSTLNTPQLLREAVDETLQSMKPDTKKLASQIYQLS